MDRVSDILLAHEPAIRLGVMLAILALMIGWEALAPRRQVVFGRRRRWPVNLGLLAVDGLVLRLIFPAAAVGLAVAVQAAGWGLLNAVAWPLWAEWIVALLALDLAIYGQHVAFHRVPLLWRLHRVHHTDLEFDVTTGLRFHPVEILLSMAFKGVVIALLGPAPAAVLLFEVLLNATSLFNHGNVRLPAGLDRRLRWIVVTPEMHRVHHSARRPETDSNFGFNLPWWDRLFGTYRAQPADGHEDMTIGVADWRDPRTLGLWRLLLQPLR